MPAPERVTCVVGAVANSGRTLDALAGEHGFAAGALDFLFLDHDKDYLLDLQSILDRGWLHTGSIVVADDLKVPGAPKYREYMRQQQGKLFNTTEHKTHAWNIELDLRPGAGMDLLGGFWFRRGSRAERARGWASAQTRAVRAR